MRRQPVLAVNQSEWVLINNTRAYADAEDHSVDLLPDPQLDIEALVADGEGGWLEDVVCPVRVLYVGHSETQLQGTQLSAGLPQPGLYNLLVRHEINMSDPSMHLTYVNSGRTPFKGFFRWNCGPSLLL